MNLTGPSGWKGQLMGFAWSGGDDLTEREIEDALDTIATAHVPMKNNEVIQLLTRLRLMTKSRAESQDDVTMQTAVYRDALLAYPADIVRGVLLLWPTRNTFWPAWKELQDEITASMHRRRKLEDALRARIARMRDAA